MDEPAADVEGDEAEGPEDQEDERDRPEHGVVSLRLAALARQGRRQGIGAFVMRPAEVPLYFADLLLQFAGGLLRLPLELLAEVALGGAGHLVQLPFHPVHDAL